ncbi:MAG: hybrid sensor histidine kinase/response regulator, partial [Calditrichaeota bacterium]|nr:hybrid sensor histidine kinase/response regulator [Calditrichota bacterium]
MIEESITVSEKFDQESINLSPMGIAFFDADGAILQANSMLLQMMEVSDINDDYKALDKLEELLYNTVENESKYLIDRLLTGETIQIKEIEYTLLSGVKKWINISGKPQYDLNGEVNGATLIYSDVTDYMELQAQLRQAQKMEALGQLTSGVAHDFNNLLTVIIGNTELMLTSSDINSIFQNNVEEIQKAAERATYLTNQLLAFSRKRPMKQSVINLNSIINDMEQILRRTLRENIELLVITEPNLWKIEANPGQIEQIIINLAANSRDAMPQGGKLIIETANTRLNKEYAGGDPEINPGKYVMLAITDTGCGMTEEVKSKLFDSFFTTKELGKGTGLGLSTTYSYVKQAGGYIWVYSELEQGTTFKIILPLAEKEMDSFDLKMLNESIPQGSETILVVEDEDEVRRTVVRMLKKHGYKIEAFR